MEKRKRRIVFGGIAVLTVTLNLLARFSKGFCDVYIEYVLPIWVNTLSRVMGWLPFSVGELLIAAGAVMVLAAILLAFVLAGIGCRKWYMAVRPRKFSDMTAKRYSSDKMISFSKKYYTVFAWVLLIVLLLMTLNSFIMYHGSTFSESYFGTVDEEYTLEELIAVRNYVVEKCNQLSREMERDTEGAVVYNGNDRDMIRTARESMQNLGKTYSQLDGYYPSLKSMTFSDFISQQYIQGYFFPFTMEANYNDVMFILNKPATMCHELAHLRGYILEDEANFIGFLACVGSDDKFFEYSGYLSVLYYLDNDFYRSVGNNREVYLEQVNILSEVREDNIFLTAREWERIEGKALFDTETVDAVSDTLMDASLKANGVSDGKVSYSRVVKLLLQYYKLNGLLDDLN